MNSNFSSNWWLGCGAQFNVGNSSIEVDNGFNTSANGVVMSKVGLRYDERQQWRIEIRLDISTILPSQRDVRNGFAFYLISNNFSSIEMCSNFGLPSNTGGAKLGVRLFTSPVDSMGAFGIYSNSPNSTMLWNTSNVFQQPFLFEGCTGLFAAGITQSVLRDLIMVLQFDGTSLRVRFLFLLFSDFEIINCRLVCITGCIWHPFTAFDIVRLHTQRLTSKIVNISHPAFSICRRQWRSNCSQ